MQRRKLTSINEIAKGLVWVRLDYADGSQWCFQTTLDPSELSSRNIILEEGCLVRLDKKYLIRNSMLYRQFPVKEAKLSFWDGENYTHKQSKFLSQFL